MSTFSKRNSFLDPPDRPIYDRWAQLTGKPSGAPDGRSRPVYDVVILSTWRIKAKYTVMQCGYYLPISSNSFP